MWMLVDETENKTFPAQWNTKFKVLIKLNNSPKPCNYSIHTSLLGTSVSQTWDSARFSHQPADQHVKFLSIFSCCLLGCTEKKRNEIILFSISVSKALGRKKWEQQKCQRSLLSAFREQVLACFSVIKCGSVHVNVSAGPAGSGLPPHKV